MFCLMARFGAVMAQDALIIYLLLLLLSPQLRQTLSVITIKSIPGLEQMDFGVLLRQLMRIAVRTVPRTFSLQHIQTVFHVLTQALHALMAILQPVLILALQAEQPAAHALLIAQDVILMERKKAWCQNHALPLM
jgi:hypothetical protein